MLKLDEQLLAKINQRAKLSQLRERLSLTSSQGSIIEINGKYFDNFSSNDYLGLANHTETLNIIKQQLDESGFGSGASHLITGHHKIHQQLENELADFLVRDSAITFSTGYMANLAILQTLAKKGDLIIADKLNHASLIDGVKLSSADSVRYQHCNIKKLQARLKSSAANKWVVTDSVFSMDGDIAPLDEISALCKKYNAHLIVDDAHGIGVLGREGKGCAEYFNLGQSELPILMGTFGKALGGFGAFVSGSKALTSYLMQFSRSYIYTTALPSAIAAANLFNLKLIKDDQKYRVNLNKNIQYFKQQCKKESVELMPSETAIQPMMIGCSKKITEVSEQLKTNGFLVGAIRPPTVAKNTDRLRVTLSASHQFEQISRLVKQLKMINKV